MQQLMEKLKCQANRDSTKRMYYGVWKNFNQFIIRLDQKPKTWEERLVLYVGFLVENNKKSATVRSYVSAIKSVLKQDNVELNENAYLIAALMKACKLVNDRVRTHLPIHKNLLNMIIYQVQMFFESRSQMYLSVIYSAIFVAA